MRNTQVNYRLLSSQLPRPCQKEMVRLLALGYKKIIFMMYRQAGKTTFVRQCQAHYLFFNSEPDPVNILFAPTLKQCKRLYLNQMLNFFERLHPRYDKDLDIFHVRSPAPFNKPCQILFNGTDTSLEEGKKQTSRGGTASGILFGDEYGDWPEGFAQAVVLPMTDNFGIPALFTGTPRGPNHFMYDFDFAKKMMLRGDRDYAVLKWTIDDGLRAGEVSPQKYEAIRKRYSGKYQHIWDAEYMLKFFAYFPGQIFGREVSQAYDSGRVSDSFPNYNIPIECYWDIGTNGTAVWLVQRYMGMFHLVAYLEDLDNVTFFEFIKTKLLYMQHTYEMNIKAHYFPHDIAFKDFSSRDTRLVLARRLLRVPCIKLKPVTRVHEHLDIARRNFNRCVFYRSAPGVDQGLSRLARYKMKGLKPEKNADSHGADAFVMAMTLPVVQDPKEIYSRHLTPVNRLDYFTNHEKRKKTRAWFID